MRLIPLTPQLNGTRSLAVKRFMARYIFYLETFGFIAVSLVALAVVSCFFFKIDDIIRLDGDPVAIKPRAEGIKGKADLLVTRVFVRNHQEVRRNDPLVEVVENPGWKSRYLVMRQMQALLDEFDAPGQAAELAKKRIEQAQQEAREAALASAKKIGPAITESEAKKEEEKEPLPVVPLTPEEQKVRALIQQRLAHWSAHEMPKSPRFVLRAPIDGIVVAPDDLAFKMVDADAEVLKVVDLDDLRITGKLKGETLPDAREGQQAVVKAIIPERKTGMIFRGDTVPQGRYFWQKERVTSFSLLDPKLKDTVKEAFKDRKITRRDDIPFDMTEVTDVEVNADLKTVPLANAPLPDITADLPGEMELGGHVVDGKHVLTVQLADMPPSVKQEVTQQVGEAVTGKIIEAPDRPKKHGGPVPLHHLRVEGVRGVQVIAKMKAENPEPKGKTDRLKKEAARNAVRGASLDRLYEATIRIDNPPPVLKKRVLELLEQGKVVKARVEIKTGRRPIAFILLKR
jgi:multidrug resistance efflux pump